MSEQPSLADVVDAALGEYFAKSDMPGIVTAFTLVIERVRADGNTGITVVSPDQQSPSRTLGLVGWADEHTRDEIRYTLNAPYLIAGDPEDED